MAKIKGWKKTGLITASGGSQEETYYNLPLQVSVVKWGKNLLHFPNTTVFIYENNKQIFKKTFDNYKKAKNYAMKYMRSHPNG